MIFKKTLLAAVAAVAASGLAAQSYDGLLGDAISRSDWFALDSVYAAAPKDSISPMLEVYSRALIGNRLNRPQLSIPAFQELLSSYSESLGLDNLISVAFMYGMDLSRTGDNEAAASMTRAIADATREYLDSATVAQLSVQANQYTALARYAPYQITVAPGEQAAVPFGIVRVGAKDKEAYLMRLEDTYINGTTADITFDTGAGANVITPALVERYGLIPLEETRITVDGFARRDGYYAIARELKMGNITVTDVPFIVVDMTTGNEEADQHIDCFSIVVGSDLMLRLRDVTIDFDANRISVTSPTPCVPDKTDARSNLCFSSGMNLLCRGTANGEPILMNIDSGDASYGSLGYRFFEENKEYVLAAGAKDSVRRAGVGGAVVSECYRLPDVRISLGGNVASVPQMNVLTVPSEEGGARYECNLGLRTLMLYSFVRFNLADFILTTGSLRDCAAR